MLPELYAELLHSQIGVDSIYCVQLSLILERMFAHVGQKMIYDAYYPQNDEIEADLYDFVPEMETEWVYEEAVYEEEFYDPPLYEAAYHEYSYRSGVRPQWLLLPVLLLTIWLLFVLGQGAMGKVMDAEGETAVAPPSQAETDLPIGGAPADFISPYDEYIITQGLHGYAYGHMAIDLTAGAGAVIKAPITGEITALYMDEYGNTTLLLENERYQVTFLHGEYIAVVGQKIRQGDPIGTESNYGYTMDSAGNLCYGRAECGYHTHLNVFDKQINANINPLGLIQ